MRLSWLFLLLGCLSSVVVAQNDVVVVSAASFKREAIAPDSIASAFGVGLAVETRGADSKPLPTSLAGTTVLINETLAPLFFVSPNQVNFLVPETIPVGQATIEVRAASGAVARGQFPVRRAGPGIFAVNGTPPAGVALRVRADQSQAFEQILRCNAGGCVPAPLDLGPEGDKVFLVFFATGVRNATVTRVLLGGKEYQPIFAGAQGDLVGLDQVNLELPRELIGRGRVELQLFAEGFVSNPVELDLAYRPGSAPPRVTGFNVAAALAGETVVINGSDFATAAANNQVRIGELEARVVSASPTQLTVEVPFGVRAGRVSVKTPLGDAASNSEIEVRTSISGLITDTADPPRPLSGVRVTASSGNVMKTALSNNSGAFVLSDVLAGAASGNVDLTIDGSTAAGVTPTVPYPSLKTKMRVLARQDNRFPMPVALQLVTGPGTGQTGNLVGTNNANKHGVAFTAQQPIRLETDNVVLEIPAGAGLSNRLNLTVVNQSRVPAQLPAATFSQHIAQLTPFGATINPGAKLSFPNPDKEQLRAGAEVRLFKFDKDSLLNAEEAFKPVLGDAGRAVVSADGNRIETRGDAIKEASYYFVAVPQTQTTALGRVVDGAQPVRQAVVRVRGQSDFTDGNGGFTPREAAVKQNDSLTAETSYQNSSNGTLITLKTVAANVGGLTNFGDIPVNQLSTNRPPVLTVPVEPVVLNPGEVRELIFNARDPDDDDRITIQFELIPQSLPNANPSPKFAEVAAAPRAPNFEGRIRLAPGVADIGEYALKITVQENAGERLLITRAVSILVQGRPGEFTATARAECDTVAPSGPVVRLNWTAAVRAQSYDIARNGVMIQRGLTALSYNDKQSIEAGVSYSYQVTARNGGLTQNAPTVNVTVPATICATSSVTVTLGLPVESGDTVTFPLEIGDLTRRGVIAYEFDLAFDPAVLSFLAVEKENSLSSGMSVVTNVTPAPGNLNLLRVAAYVATPVAGANRVLLQLRFRIAGRPGMSTLLAWQKFMLNENNPSVTLTTRSYTVR